MGVAGFLVNFFKDRGVDLRLVWLCGIHLWRGGTEGAIHTFSRSDTLIAAPGSRTLPTVR